MRKRGNNFSVNEKDEKLVQICKQKSVMTDCLLHRWQRQNPYRTALRPTQPRIQCVTRALSMGIKQPRREADHSPHLLAEIKNEWSYVSPLPNTPSWRGAQLKAQGQLYLYLSKKIIAPQN